MEIVAIIPARGGSVGIPKKNVAPLCGHPLIAWTIGQALASKYISSVFVSTDSEEIADVSLSYGAKIIKRPEEISGSKASSESALIHACHEIRSRHGHLPDLVLFLQATSPLRESDDLDQAVEKFANDKLDSLFCAARPEDMLLWSACAPSNATSSNSTYELRSLNYDYKTRTPRQDLDESQKIIIETGSFYLTRTDLLIKEKNRLVGKIGYFEVPVWKSFEIDTHQDLELCEALMKQYKLDLKQPSLSKDYLLKDQAKFCSNL